MDERFKSQYKISLKLLISMVLPVPLMPWPSLASILFQNYATNIMLFNHQHEFSPEMNPPCSISSPIMKLAYDAILVTLEAFLLLFRFIHQEYVHA